ncbi:MULTISPECIES: hypothetical protein [Streptosporangium]|uniref:DUF2157 domain-containing protein n=1 Tax=Streptosporangium brasiliense TaxID=47480 RepID=A0ABT9RDE3_9ACTN|nr:hypothetical protein [Streptosporangium brasiliense]MDP9867273.1 hypothetical protein [Streptosporangium brasiliense]
MNPLERRYRRLMACYPREHRARHEEEMIGVLLTGAEPGRRLPDPRDALDLVRGGVQIRLQRFLGPEAATHWRDALNVAAVVAPVYLLVVQVAGTVVLLWPSDPGLSAYNLLGLVGLLPNALIVGLALRGLRWTAAAAAWILGLAGPVVTAVATADLVERTGGPGAYPPVGVPTLAEQALWALPVLIPALLLTAAPRPAEGAELIGRRRLLLWAAVSTVALAAATAFWYGWSADDYANVLLGPALAAMACGAGSRTPAGRRAILLLSPMLLLMYGDGLIRRTFDGRWFLSLVEILLVGVLAVVARRGFRPYGTGTVSSPERLV